MALGTPSIKFLVEGVPSVRTVNEDDRVRGVAEERWLEVVEDFNNETVHNAFVEYCIATRQLPLAGRVPEPVANKRGTPSSSIHVLKELCSVHKSTTFPTEKGKSCKTQPLATTVCRSAVSPVRIHRSSPLDFIS